MKAATKRRIARLEGGCARKGKFHVIIADEALSTTEVTGTLKLKTEREDLVVRIRTFGDVASGNPPKLVTHEMR